MLSLSIKSWELQFSGNAAAIESYKSTPVVYRRTLSPEATALRAASGRTSDDVRAYREPDDSGITILPGFADFADSTKEFSDYHGMKIGQGGDATLFQVIAHEHGHVLDKVNAKPGDREKAASDHANSMKRNAPREIRKELKYR